MPRNVEVVWEDHSVVCHLPITLPTSKVRVKRDRHPLATRRSTLQATDLIEWQISYFDEQRNLVELGQMLRLGFLHSVIRKGELRELRQFTGRVHSFFAAEFQIRVESSQETFQGFEVCFGKYPILRKDVGSDGVFLEIKLKHKQRAVGYQPMLYLLIPVASVSPCLVGKTADQNQIVQWRPSKAALLETTRGFAIASESHRNDLLELVTTILDG